MKKILTFLFVLALVPLMQAQWVVESFDNAVGTTFSDPPVYNSNFFASTETCEFNLTNDPDHMEGTGSMKLDYRIEAAASWGGYIVRTTYIAADADALPYIDYSTGTELKLRYKVLTPVNMTQTGTAFIELKFAEYDENGDREIWYHHTSIDLSDVSGNWIEITMPLEENSNNTLGFTLQSDLGVVDGIFQFHHIKGIEVTGVYVTAGGTVNPPVATGALLLDKFELSGSRYPSIFTFDNSTQGWGLDWMDWAGTDKGAIAVADEGVDYVEGVGSLNVDYTLSAPYDWGGFVSIDSAVTVDTTINERTALVLFVKNLVPVVADSGRAFIRLFVMEKSNGVDVEEWITDIGIDLSEASDWNRYYLPLVAKPMGVK